MNPVCRLPFLLATCLAAVAVLPFSGLSIVPPASVSFAQPAAELDVHDFAELTASVSLPRASNPFTDAAMRGTFELAEAKRRWQVDGFCDAEDGSTYRLRFMPTAPGDYTYQVEYRQGWRRWVASGAFRARDGGRRGPIRVDPQNGWHFIWEGTGEHCFLNGITAYWLAGWTDESVIRFSLERLHRLKVNRIRVTVAGRTDVYYGERAVAGPAWTPLVRPWSTDRSVPLLRLIGHTGQRLGLGLARGLFDSLADLGEAADIYHPGFDYARFDVSYWQKLDRALRFARDRDLVFSLVLDMNDSRVHPLPASADERRFIRYAVARFAAFSNITWDLGDDIDMYRDDRWIRDTGTLIKRWDPYRHLTTSHPVDNRHQDRTAEWFDFASFQDWSRNQHAFMLAQREEQKRLGRAIPLLNEEYGYEDSYPMWAQWPGSDSADALRRTAWTIVMAGGYQTTGETTRRGTNIWPDTGGGWLNGRGDDTMIMLEGYSHMVDFFTGFEWWKTEPHDELVSGGGYCLARPGEAYAVYLPQAAEVTLRLEPGLYTAEWWDPSDGARTELPPLRAASSPWRFVPPVEGPRTRDWALLVRRR